MAKKLKADPEPVEPPPAHWTTPKPVSAMLPAERKAAIRELAAMILDPKIPLWKALEFAQAHDIEWKEGKGKWV